MFKKQLLAFIFLTCSGITFGIDNVHFYRANHFWGEPRFERPWLMSWDTNIGWAHATNGRNGDGKTTSVLDIYGFHNMQFLGKNVPNLDPANPLDAILIDLAALPQNGTFGELSYSARFSLIETVFDIYQNIYNGFFLQAYLPVRKLEFSKIRFEDLSPDDTSTTPNVTNPTWQSFLQNMPAIFQRHKLSTKPLHTVGVGDFSILGGWARNYENTTYLDYVDVDAKIGVLFPTGKQRNPYQVFSLPTGYNGHWGVPLKFNVALGLYEWITIGMHLGALFFVEKTETIRVKTDAEQSGLFYIPAPEVKFDEGSILDFSLYFKADHFYRGLSFLAGYSYNHKEKDCIELKKNDFDITIFTHDQRFAGYDQQVFHFLIEYDFAEDLDHNASRVGFFYNRIVGGKRIYNANLKSFNWGIETLWKF